MTDTPVAELIAELEAVVQFIRPAAARPTITAAAAALRALSAENERLRRERDSAWGKGFDAGKDAASEYVLRIGSYGCETSAYDIRCLPPPPATEAGS